MTLCTLNAVQFPKPPNPHRGRQPCAYFTARRTARSGWYRKNNPSGSATSFSSSSVEGSSIPA